MPTDEDLTALYNQANDLDAKRYAPITTARIFAAMRAAMALERQRCIQTVAGIRKQVQDLDEKDPAPDLSTEQWLAVAEGEVRAGGPRPGPSTGV